MICGVRACKHNSLHKLVWSSLFRHINLYLIPWVGLFQTAEELFSYNCINEGNKIMLSNDFLVIRRPHLCCGNQIVCTHITVNLWDQPGPVEMADSTSKHVKDRIWNIPSICVNEHLLHTFLCKFLLFTCKRGCQLYKVRKNYHSI